MQCSASEQYIGWSPLISCTPVVACCCLSIPERRCRPPGSGGSPVKTGVAVFQVVGGGRTPIVDTWWQTETGAHMITPLPGATALKPGSATLPFFGVEPVLLDDKV